MPSHSITASSPRRAPTCSSTPTIPWTGTPGARRPSKQPKKEDKPIFLSIGYSTCHWCHVMAHESFEDPDVAALLNQSFICIKVDREERPDIDQMYMAAARHDRQRRLASYYHHDSG